MPSRGTLRASGGRAPAAVLRGAILASLGCSAVPSSTGAAEPAPSVSASDAGAALPPVASPPAPRRAFVEIEDGPCDDLPEVIDEGDATLLLSRTQARHCEPGRAEIVEVTGLPSPRGSAFAFAKRPFILAVERPNPKPLKPDTLNIVGYFILDRATRAFSRVETKRFEPPAVFGDYPMAFSFGSGTLVVTYVQHEKRRAEPGYSVPAGDGSEALYVEPDGQVRPFPAWPDVLFAKAFSTDGVVWAVSTQPATPGNFVLRVPLRGPAKQFPVPGTRGCRGEERFSYPATLVEEGASADEITVEVSELSSCAAKGAGRYRLTAPDARWQKLPPVDEALGEPAPSERPAPVKIGDATMRIDGHRVLIALPGGSGEIDGAPDPVGDPAEARALTVTAGGREVFLRTRWKTHCRLERYRSF